MLLSETVYLNGHYYPAGKHDELEVPTFLDSKELSKVRAFCSFLDYAIFFVFLTNLIVRLFLMKLAGKVY